MRWYYVLLVVSMLVLGSCAQWTAREAAPAQASAPVTATTPTQADPSQNPDGLGPNGMPLELGG